MTWVVTGKASGVLLPVSALPGGKISWAAKFIDWLSLSGQKFWQVLPLNPRDHLGSPYNSGCLTKFDNDYFSSGSQEDHLQDWLAVKKYANKQGIKIIGDLPYFVPANSEGAKNHQNYFLFDQLSGNPPDLLSKKGQAWGHPQYNWEEIKKDNFRLFLDRFKWCMRVYDVVRLDHFRGYEAVWSIPAGKEITAGRWVEVPGEDLFKKATKDLPTLPFIAEDLGIITSEVENMRRKFEFLGTRVIQYGKSQEKDVVFYSSTHDSPTLAGFFGKRKAERLLAEMFKLPASLTMVYFPDLLGLGNEARFNRPGKKSGNWKWRTKESDFSVEAAEKLRSLTEGSGRN